MSKEISSLWGMIQDPGSGIDLSSVRMTIDTVRAAGWVDNSKWMPDGIESFSSLASMLSNAMTFSDSKLLVK